MRDEITSWQAKSRTSKSEELQAAANELNTLHYIDLVRAPQHMGVFASTGRSFHWAIFGRDSIEVAEDILTIDQPLVHDIILELAALQGVQTNLTSEEEYGKIHHEFRSLTMSPVGIPKMARTILYKLQEVWDSSEDDELIYYGSVDATPLYVRLLGLYVERYGTAILSETYQDRAGKPCTIQDSTRRALNWIVTKIEQSSWRLLEYKRLNTQHGLTNQAWKDSPTAYMHDNGTVANFDGGIASLEVQGYVYDALRAGSVLDAERAAKYTMLATEIQQTVLSLFWMEDKQFFAQGLDRDDKGAHRQIRTLTSNAGALLDTKLLLELPEKERRRYVDALVAKLMDTRLFLTPAGIRCRDILFDAKLDFVDYHGANTVWPKETYDIAKGLRRHGYDVLAADLQARIVQSIIKAGEFSEFFYAAADGTIYYDSIEGVRRFENAYSSEKSPIPESDQAWTIAAFIGCLKKS